METTLQPSSQRNASIKIALIEAMELAILGFGLWALMAAMSVRTPEYSLADLFVFLLITEGLLLGSWMIYNVYIRIARAGGRTVDIGLWIVASALTGSYTFWAWTMLDINRFFLAKLLYRGEAPVEYAWSIRSKQDRKTWERAQRAVHA